MKNAFIIGLSLFFISPVLANGASPSIAVAFSPRHGATKTVVEFINEAQQSIHLAGYSFTSEPIAEALVSARKRGIEVSVVLDKSNMTDHHTVASYLASNDVPVRIDYHYSIMHDKYVVIDSVSTETGSFNFTKAAEKSNAENVIIIRNDAATAKIFDENWQMLWDESEPYKQRY